MEENKRREIKETLGGSERMFHSMIDNAVEGIFQTTPEGDFIYVNSSLAAILGFESPQELMEEISNIGKQQYVDPEDREKFKKVLERESMIREFETQLFSKEGGIIWVSLTARTIRDSDGVVVYYEGMMIDITKRKFFEESIKKLLAEKELLLREVHHRIKNNMNLVMSLLSLQAGMLQDPSSVAALKEARGRVQSMMVLYDKLYRSSDFMKISSREYFSSLIDEIVGNFPNLKSVAIEKQIDDCILDSKILSTVGMVLNELLTNAMKYAFIIGGEGVIKISLSLEDNRVTLVIQDNGVGMSESIDVHNSTGFGLYVVGELTEQLEGKIRIERENGTAFILEFEI